MVSLFIVFTLNVHALPAVPGDPIKVVNDIKEKEEEKKEYAVTQVIDASGKSANTALSSGEGNWEQNGEWNNIYKGNNSSYSENAESGNFSLASLVSLVDSGICAEITIDLSRQARAFAMAAIEVFLENVSEMFNPSLSLLYRVSSGQNPYSKGYSTDYTYTDGNGNTSGFIQMFQSYSQYFGITISSLLFLWGIIFYFFNHKLLETKNNPISLTVLYFLSLLGIYYADDIMNYFLETAQDIWEFAINITSTGNLRTLSSEDFFFCSSKSLFGTPIHSVGLVVGALFDLLALYLTWLVFKGFLRLILEMAERYLVVCIMVFFFPCVLPTIISKETSIIMKSYIRMMISHLFLLITGVIFMKGFVLLTLAGALNTLVGFILIMAYLRTAQRLDSYMASMGLNVAQTGAGLIDSFGMAGQAFGSALRDINNMRKGTAGLVKASAITGGKAGLFKAASIAGFNVMDAIKAGGLSQMGSNLDFIKKTGIAGEKLKEGAVPLSAAKEMLDKYMNNPTRDNMMSVSALHNNDLKKVLQSSGGIPTGMHLNHVALSRSGDLVASGTTKNGTDVKGTISKAALNKNSIATPSGNYFTPQNTMAKGSVMSVGSRSDLNSALMSAGKPNAGLHLNTMDQYNALKSSGNVAAANAMMKQGVVEALHEAGGLAGTQVLTGENSPYGAGMPIGNIDKDGNYTAYSRFEQDADITRNMANLSDEDKDMALFGKNYFDLNNSYDWDNLPSYEQAMSNLSDIDAKTIGAATDNLGYGYENVEFLEGDDGQAHLSIDYMDYDFGRDELNSLYQDWNVIEDAVPTRNQYGQQSIAVYNEDTDEYGNMLLSNMSVYGGIANDDSRIISSRYGDDYIVSISKEKPEIPDLDADNFNTPYERQQHEELRIEDSPAANANQSAYENVSAREVPQSAMDEILRRRQTK